MDLVQVFKISKMVLYSEFPVLGGMFSFFYFLVPYSSFGFLDTLRGIFGFGLSFENSKNGFRFRMPTFGGSVFLIFYIFLLLIAFLGFWVLWGFFLGFGFLVLKIWKMVLESECPLLGGSIFLIFSIFLHLIAFLGFGYFRGSFWICLSLENFKNSFEFRMPTFGEELFS